MMVHKRSISSLDDHASQPNKFSKAETISADADALLSAKARIVDLEHQVKNLHAFINVNGLTRMAPESIRQHMLTGPDAAKTLADQIASTARKVSNKLHNKTLNAKKTGITSDDMSNAMIPFLDEVEQLRALPHSTAIAFDLVMVLGKYSYGELDGKACGYDDRPSDLAVDDLLFALATERKEIDPSWDFLSTLRTLQERANTWLTTVSKIFAPRPSTSYLRGGTFYRRMSSSPKGIEMEESHRLVKA